MRAVSVSGLKQNPAQALRQAKSSPVVLLNRERTDAVLIGLEEGGLLQTPGVRAAHMAARDVASFIDHLAVRPTPPHGGALRGGQRPGVDREAGPGAIPRKRCPTTAPP
jgi:hypothetical protein